MPDVVSPETRSRMMAGIRGKDTKPELMLRRALHAHGFRYRLHDRKLPGKPDLVFPKYKAAVFVHGCFWHGHKGCKYFKVPATRTEFWTDKIAGNQVRDDRALSLLSEDGWRTAVVWECATRNSMDLVLGRIEEWLTGTKQRVEVSWQ